MQTIDDITIRIPAALLNEAKTWAERDATSVEQFVQDAIERRIAARRDAQSFAARAARGSLGHFDRILAKAGTQQPLRPGDEIPEGWLTQP